MKTPIYTGLFQSDLDANGYRISGLLTPSAGTDAATKAYVDAHAGGGGGGGGTSLGYVNIKDAPYSAAGDGVSDDTAALQGAIDALAAVGGGRIYFPPGTYLIAGALQDTSGRNAQILLPVVSTSSPAVTIEFMGALSPPTQYYSGTPPPAATAYSIIKSTLTGATGTAAFIAGKVIGGELWGNVQLIVRDMIFEAPPNPSFTAFNCSGIMGPQIEHVLIHAGSVGLNTITEPTHTNAAAIRMAPYSHSAGQRISVADVFGFYVGMVDGELAESHINFWGCKQGVLVPFTFHLSTYRHLGIFHCPRGIVAGAGGVDGTHYIRVFACAIEHSNSAGGWGQPWQDCLYDVDDSLNLLIGDLKWLSILGGIGNDHSFIKNGGTRLLTSELGTNDPFYIGTDARLTAISGGVKLEVRNAATGVWVEATRYTNP